MTKSRVSVGVYTCTEMVARLSDPSRHRHTPWSGRKGLGQPAGAGIYFLRSRRAGVLASRKCCSLIESRSESLRASRDLCLHRFHRLGTVPAPCDLNLLTTDARPDSRL